ncbi:MAG TPA: hypothetical protein VF705_08625, partial [Longimicrobium sp.]
MATEKDTNELAEPMPVEQEEVSAIGIGSRPPQPPRGIPTRAPNTDPLKRVEPVVPVNPTRPPSREDIPEPFTKEEKENHQGGDDQPGRELNVFAR